MHVHTCRGGGGVYMESTYVKVASGRFFLAGAGDDDYHFLDACFLCKRDITFNHHLFMYKGDAAFCSDDCRQDQMDMDAALDAVKRRHRVMLRDSSPPTSTSASCTVNKAVAVPTPAIARRRPTVADLAARRVQLAAGN